MLRKKVISRSRSSFSSTGSIYRSLLCYPLAIKPMEGVASPVTHFIRCEVILRDAIFARFSTPNIPKSRKRMCTDTLRQTVLMTQRNTLRNLARTPSATINDRLPACNAHSTQRSESRGAKTVGGGGRPATKDEDKGFGLKISTSKAAFTKCITVSAR